MFSVRCEKCGSEKDMSDFSTNINLVSHPKYAPHGLWVCDICDDKLRITNEGVLQ